MLLWGIMMVRDHILSRGLDTVSQCLYARLCKVWCTTMVAFLVRARFSDHLSSYYFTPRTAMRWMLGTMEAGLFPGVTYYLSWYTSHCHLIQSPTLNPSGVLFSSFHSWYKRSEYGLRAAIFFSAASVSGAFGGLLAVRGPISRGISASCHTASLARARRPSQTWMG